MFATPISTDSQPLLPGNSLGGVQHDIFFSVMKIIHRQSPPLLYSVCELTPTRSLSKRREYSCKEMF